ncbi:hypothetical protein [Kineosporia succinea]|uniref:Uncharacterized protein n=1 Tax=Kineosporia succinea TaxID=84632 RepID=A0ABT9PAC1_9ACTN|nr:hypothetical protein [Kineosporia succinea]MDP9828995.1 hypothetical protein [Kineosporia succinea]
MFSHDLSGPGGDHGRVGAGFQGCSVLLELVAADAELLVRGFALRGQMRILAGLVQKIDGAFASGRGEQVLEPVVEALVILSSRT